MKPVATLVRWSGPLLGMLALSTALTYGASLIAGGGTPASVHAQSSTAVVASTESGVAWDPLSGRLILEAVSNGWMPERFRGYCADN